MPPTIDPNLANDPGFHAALEDVAARSEECREHHAMMAAAPGTSFDVCAYYREYRPKAEALVAALANLAIFLPQLSAVPTAFRVVEQIVDGFCPPAQ